MAAIVYLLVWRLDPSLRRWRAFKVELAAREPMTDADMAVLHFVAGDLAAKVAGDVRRMFAEHLNLPAEYLRPDEDLAPLWIDLEMVELMMDLETAFGIDFANAEIDQTPCTIRAVSRLIAEKSLRTE